MAFGYFQKLKKGPLKAMILDDIVDLCTAFYCDPDEILRGGFQSTIHVRTAKTTCQIADIYWKKGSSTNHERLEIMELKSQQFLESGDEAEVVFMPNKPFVVMPFDECKSLGQIVAMEGKSLIMSGNVTNVTYL